MGNDVGHTHSHTHKKSPLTYSDHDNDSDNKPITNARAVCRAHTHKKADEYELISGARRERKRKFSIGNFF